MPHVLLEICCGSLDDALEAGAGGADRVELCSSLFHGGLTPSFGTLVEAKARLDIPVIFMARPRGGGFCYTATEMAAMERDTEMAVAQGADGVVFGILTEDGRIDLPRTRRLRDRVGDRDAVFHRAFDVTPDPFRALDELIDLGITRVLTSGQCDTVWEGMPLIARLIDYAAGRIQIMPGGGIKPFHVDEVIARTGCRQIHIAAWKTERDDSTRHRPAVTFGGALYPPENLYDVTDRAVVRDIAHRLKR
ncbi:MAG TPA: copper homeostasis protein CutC [Vicinamibacterales bacterium]|nr:copper homeostasis protein CutC [Vicinamibacterales bacterium]HOG29353.1 copper homeostasis protein CutC [Vicinamibacterales bacterium]HOQ61923.1 copper homeostasis protein CutC [Vicinamibacterales bacterium]HPW21150.1 copper homeostasis protein CutC [Vicinamibacterales bacterium]